MQKGACTLSAALIGLIDLRVPGLKVVVIIGLLAGNSRCTLTLIRHVRLIRGSHYEGGTLLTYSLSDSWRAARQKCLLLSSEAANGATAEVHHYVIMLLYKKYYK